MPRGITHITLEILDNSGVPGAPPQQVDAALRAQHELEFAETAPDGTLAAVREIAPKTRSAEPAARSPQR